MPQVSGLPAQLSYPGQTNYSYIFFTKSFQGLHARWGGGGGGGLPFCWKEPVGMNNDKGFSKISKKKTEQDGTYHLKFSSSSV